jgi:hypothetical protein
MAARVPAGVDEHRRPLARLDGNTLKPLKKAVTLIPGDGGKLDAGAAATDRRYFYGRAHAFAAHRTVAPAGQRHDGALCA